MLGTAASLSRRADSLSRRIDGLAGLRELVALEPANDISARQWRAIDTLFGGIHAQLDARLRSALRNLLAEADQPPVARKLNGELGAIELELARVYPAFDLYADILTQRHAGELGALLAGCDVIADWAIKRDHPALRSVQPPLVYCDRGFGASIIREGVNLGRKHGNALPVIQIPYSRLNSEKYNLTSILHEAGHQVLIQLNLLPAMRNLARRAIGEPDLQHCFALWMPEIGPDFWSFGLSGLAQAGAVKEVLALPPEQVFHVSRLDPHPPPYLRALLSFEWCRQLWGRGVWDLWEREWRMLYPLSQAGGNARLLDRGRRVLPALARALIEARFAALGDKPLTSLFELAALSPDRIERAVQANRPGGIDLGGLPLGAQLAVFRLAREHNLMGEAALDRTMTTWLAKLGGRGRPVVWPGKGLRLAASTNLSASL